METKQYLFALMIFFSSSYIFADTNNEDITRIEQMLTQYSKKDIVNYIMDKRYGEVTVEVGGSLENKFGKPRLDMVNKNTVLNDFNKIGLPIEDIENQLETRINKQEKKKKERQEYYNSDAYKENKSKIAAKKEKEKQACLSSKAEAKKWLSNSRGPGVDCGSATNSGSRACLDRDRYGAAAKKKCN